MSVKEANLVMSQYSDSILTQNKAIRLIGGEYRATNAATLEGMRALQSVASIGSTMLNVYNSMTLGQIRLSTQTRELSDSQTRLIEIQGRLQKVSADLGSDSVYAQSLMQEETRLKKRVADDTQNLTIAQQQLNIGYIGMGLSLVGLPQKIFDLYGHFQKFKTITDGMTFSGMITGLNNAATAAIGLKTSLAGIVGPFIIPVTLAVTAAYVGSEALKANADYQNEQLKKYYGEDAPITTKKPGDPGMTGIWPGIYIDTEMNKWYQNKQNEIDQKSIGTTGEQKKQFVISGDLNVNVYNPANSDDLINQLFETLNGLGQP
jgi:hypothetical protein